MKRAILLAVAILFGASSGLSAATNTGASSTSPGHKIHKSTTHKGTVGMSKSKSKGASEYSPGDQKNDTGKY